MTMADTMADLAQWHEAQQRYWTEFAVAAVTQDGDGQFPPDWAKSSDLMDHLMGQFEPSLDACSDRADADWLALLSAGQVYRQQISRTWQEVQRDFKAHCIAIHAPGGVMPGWRAYRERWFAIAEVAFIRLQRSPAFLEAQRKTLMAWCAWFSRQPEATKQSVHLARSSAQDAHMAAMSLSPVQIAQTRKEVVWTHGKTTLSRYLPLGSARAGLRPVLICYGLIGRQTMIDLVPHRSLVRNLLAMGVDVFVIDWGSAGEEDSANDLDHYAIDLLGECIAETCRKAEHPKVTLMGICQGGVLALTHAALRGEALNGLILSGTPVDFHADQKDANPAHGLLNLWMRSLGRDGIEALVDAEQGLKGDFLGSMFNQLNPIRTVARYAVDLPEAFGDPGSLNTFMAMETWLADRPDLPHKLARTWLLDLYHDNALVQGELVVRGQKVDLGHINVPVLNFVATADHIVPPPCSTAMSRFTPPDRYTEHSISAGHVGIFVGRRAQTRTAPEIVNWLRETVRAGF